MRDGEGRGDAEDCADTDDRAGTMDEHDLTPEEKMAFQRLPREAEPSRILEERIVKSLREEGILGQRKARRPATEGMSSAARWYRPWTAAASIAASLVLFATGVGFGQWMGSRSTTEAFIQVREQDAAQLALSIQEAGSAYVSALAALGALRVTDVGAGEPGEGASQASLDFRQGREVALGALYGAVYELARLNPDDADVLRVLQILEGRRAREEGRVDDERNVIWF
jgi:hypothetical protein